MAFAMYVPTFKNFSLRYWPQEFFLEAVDHARRIGSNTLHTVVEYNFFVSQFYHKSYIFSWFCFNEFMGQV